MHELRPPCGQKVGSERCMQPQYVNIGKMDTSSACTTSTEPPHSLWSSLWSNQQLKIYLKEKEIPVSGRKNELVKRVPNFQEVEALQAELGAVACSRTSVYQHRYVSRVFQQVAGVSRACGWSVGVCLKSQTDAQLLAAASYTSFTAQLPLQCS